MSKKNGLIRIVLPQWQGGTFPVYKFGAELLAWLAPVTESPVFTVPVPEPDYELPVEDGMTGRTELKKQIDAVWDIIDDHAPEKIVMLGGDCLVDLVPFAYLSQRYGENTGILWIDTHPDVMTPNEFANAHAHVLGALMGNGDAMLTDQVTRPVKPENVMIAGIHSPTDYEQRFLAEWPVNTASPEELRSGKNIISEWIKSRGITQLLIHFDLDVLTPEEFKSVLFAKPDAKEKEFDGIAQGKLVIEEVLALFSEAESATKIVGVGITEHMPWAALQMKNMLRRIPLLND